MIPDLHALGRLLLLVGAVLALVGALLIVGMRLPWLGHLPGDIAIRHPGFSFYCPLTSCLLVSAVVSVLLWLMARGR